MLDIEPVALSPTLKVSGVRGLLLAASLVSALTGPAEMFAVQGADSCQVT